MKKSVDLEKLIALYRERGQIEVADALQDYCEGLRAEWSNKQLEAITHG